MDVAATGNIERVSKRGQKYRESGALNPFMNYGVRTGENHVAEIQRVDSINLSIYLFIYLYLSGEDCFAKRK